MKINTKQKILNAALKVFAREGFAAASMADIAKQVGIEKASLYYFFKNKEELFAAVNEFNWSELANDMRVNPLLSEERITKKELTKYLIKIIKKNAEAGLLTLDFNKCFSGSPNVFKGAMQHQVFLIERLRAFLKKNKVKNIFLAESLFINSVQGYVIRSQLRRPMPTPDAYGRYLMDLIIKQ
jgi:AcrR family transcriptional regulator